MSEPFAPLPNWLLRRTDISASAKVIFARLRQYQGENDDCWPSVQTLSAQVGIAGRNVIKQLQSLERLGLITVTRRTGSSNRYRLATGDEIATRDGNVTSDGNVTGTSDGNVTPPVTETSHKDINKRSNKRSTSSPTFATLWKAYPRKVGKAAAQRAFFKLDRPGPMMPTLLAAIERQRKSDQWTRDGGRFIPHLATWLNGERWNDEVMESVEAAAPKQLQPAGPRRILRDGQWVEVDR